MKHIEINIGNACNLKCKFCMSVYHTNLPFSVGKKNVFSKILSYYRKGYNSISFIGGEPTIFKYLNEYIRFSNLLGFKRIGIVSNVLELSNISYFEKLLKSGLNEIKASIHSFNDIEDIITQRIGAGDKKNSFLENYLVLSKIYSLDLHVQVVINKYNYTYLDDLANHLLNYKINSLRFQFMGFYKDFGEKNLVDVFINYSSLVDKLISLKKFCYAKNIDCISVSDFPICFLLHHKIISDCSEKFLGENSENIQEVFDLRNSKKFNFLKKKTYSLKEFPFDKCNQCLYRKVCTGFYKGYFESSRKLGYIEKWQEIINF